MKPKVAVLPGDGIGPEETAEAVRVLKAVGDHADRSFSFTTHAIGSAPIDAEGTGLPAATLEACLGSKAVLLGAVGHPKHDTRPAAERRLGSCPDARPDSLFGHTIDHGLVTAVFHPLDQGAAPRILREVPRHLGLHLVRQRAGARAAYHLYPRITGTTGAAQETHPT